MAGDSNQDDFNADAAARTNLEGYVELRVQLPRDVVGVIDAEVMNRGGEGANIYRATVVNEVLGPWARKKVHDATVLLRIADANPTGSAERK